jgi:hypothetical protein
MSPNGPVQQYHSQLYPPVRDFELGLSVEIFSHSVDVYLTEVRLFIATQMAECYWSGRRKLPINSLAITKVPHSRDREKISEAEFIDFDLGG